MRCSEASAHVVAFLLQLLLLGSLGGLMHGNTSAEHVIEGGGTGGSQDLEEEGQADEGNPEGIHLCLQNCANCVQFWEYGLYNGRRCAKRCFRRRAETPSAATVVDPDCNDPNMFNYSPRIIHLLLEMQQQQQQQQQQQHQQQQQQRHPVAEVGQEEMMVADQGFAMPPEVESKRRKKNRRWSTKKEEERRFQVEMKAEHRHVTRWRSNDQTVQPSAQDEKVEQESRMRQTKRTGSGRSKRRRKRRRRWRKRNL